MKTLYIFVSALALYFLGKLMGSSDHVAGFKLVFLGLLIGGVFGALGSFCHLGGRHDLLRRFGTTFIMIGGGMAVMGDPTKSTVFVPWMLMGAVLGAIGCLVFFSSSREES